MLPRLCDSGMDVVAVPYHTTRGACRINRRLENCGIPVRKVLAADLEPAEGLHRMIETLVSEKPDVCVADHVLPAFIAGYWLKHLNIPTVMVVRNDDRWYDDLIDVFVREKTEFRVGGVVVVSRELEEKLRPMLSSDIAFMRCPSSVPLPKETACWEKNRFHAVYLGRLDQPQKRITNVVQTLIEASQLLPWFSATVYGDGPLRETVEEMIAEADNHHITFGGLIDETQIFPTLLNSQVLVLFSAYEGLSSAIQEAMACGLPVISRRTKSGMAGVVQHGINAWVIKDDSELVEAVRTLAQSADYWLQLSHNARTTAEREFDIEKSADRWKTFLEKIPSDHTTVAIPPIDSQTAEQVFLKYLALKPHPEILEAESLITKAKNFGRGMPAIVYDRRRDWDGRRWLLYRAVENEVISDHEAASIAGLLVAQADSESMVSFEKKYQFASLIALSDDMKRARLMFESLLGETDDPYRKAGCLFHLGRIAVTQGRVTDAVDLLGRCIQRCPKHTAGMRLIRSLSLTVTVNGETQSRAGKSDAH